MASTESLLLSAWLEDCTHGLFQLRTEITQGRREATGEFMVNDELHPAG